MKMIDGRRMAEMAGGTILGSGQLGNISSITIDSRKARAGSLFVALPGAVQDGHEYVSDAFAHGASCALVDAAHAHRVKAKLGETQMLIVVDDTLAALQKMAKAHVEAHPSVRKVGITGSCGKTTTKEMVASILSRMGKTAKTPGNFNSEIGLPISIFEIDEHTEYGVFEMGVDHVGEMDRMLDIWRPEAAVITNIGISHVGKMGSLQVIAKEKSKLFHPSIGSAFLAESERWSRYIGRLRNVDTIPFGLATTDGVGEIHSMGLHGWTIMYHNKPIHLSSVGRHNLMNALAAISIARTMGADVGDIVDGLDRFISVPGRSRVVDGAVTVIEDYYNSSVDSTETILDYMGTLPWNGRKMAVLGSMKELGESSDAAHRRIAHRLIANGIEDIYLYGKEMESAWNELRAHGFDKNLYFTDDYESLRTRMLEDTRKGDLVLVKGSRAMAMERLVPIISSIA